MYWIFWTILALTTLVCGIGVVKRQWQLYVIKKLNKSLERKALDTNISDVSKYITDNENITLLLRDRVLEGYSGKQKEIVSHVIEKLVDNWDDPTLKEYIEIYVYSQKIHIHVSYFYRKKHVDVPSSFEIPEKEFSYIKTIHNLTSNHKSYNHEHSSYIRIH